MAKSPLLYVVDDDTELRGALEKYLSERGFEVLGLPNADEMLLRLRRRRPELVILDLMMPGTGGLTALNKLRAEGDDLPVIVLTARSDPEERITGLNAGADDYVSKPFSAGELLARIEAVLRRRLIWQAHSRAPNPGEQLRIGAFVLDPVARTLTRNGEAVELLVSDLALLRVLASHPFQPLSRERLLEMTGTRATDKKARSVDVQITRLRRLIETDPAFPKVLQTVRGVGYVFVPP